jgi:hypothetical protein
VDAVKALMGFEIWWGIVGIIKMLRRQDFFIPIVDVHL